MSIQKKVSFGSAIYYDISKKKTNFSRDDEHSSDSSIGRDNFFFSRKFLVCSGSNLLFRGLTFDFSSVRFLS